MHKAGLVVVVLLSILLPAQQPDKCSTRDHSDWVLRSLTKIGGLRVGMNRADVKVLFQEEGGLSNRLTRTYVYRECPYLKVDVQFTPVGGGTAERDEDKIARISKPYLAQVRTD